MPIPPKHVSAALLHLRKSDPVLKSLIHSVGPFRLKLQTNRFQVLARSIISQQISTKAAVSIYNRLTDLCGGDITPPSLARLKPPHFKSAGVSPQKQRYLIDLAAHVNSRSVDLNNIGRRSDEGIIDSLTQITGIGRWTAQMFLIFSLGRLDVFPHDDLGIRAAIRSLYQLPDLPDRHVSHQIATPWRPYATIASWYLWRHLEFKPPSPKS